MIEASFLTQRTVLDAVLGRAPHGATFRFTGPPPVYAGRLRQMLGESVSFENRIDALGLPAALLHLPSPRADLNLHALALDELEETLRRAHSPANLKARVARLLATNPRGRLDLGAVAKALGVSRRTLNRRLADAGSSYRDLLDSELRSRASRLLSGGAYTHAEIAERLGYADPTSFSRARRRWFEGGASGQVGNL